MNFKRKDFMLVRSFEDKLFLGLRPDYFDKEELEPEPELITNVVYDSGTDYVYIEPEPEPEEDPKEVEIAKLKEQLAALEALKELNKDELAEIIEDVAEEVKEDV